MKFSLGVLAGFLIGLVLFRGPGYIETYAAKGLPPEYAGIKMREWRNGEEVR